MEPDFIIERPTFEQCERRAKELYGDDIQILKITPKERPRFLGLFSRNTVEIAGVKMSKFARGVYPPPAKQAERQPAKQISGQTAKQSAGQPDSILPEKEKILASARNHTDTSPLLMQVLANLAAKVENLDEKITLNQKAELQHEHENILHIRTLLEQNDMLPSFREKIINRIKKEIPFDTLNNRDELEQRVLEWIGEEIKVYAEDKNAQSPRIIVLVGPTGVGKTTTVAKIAARFEFGKNYNLERNFRARFITIDLYKIGADAQLEKYAAILEIPFEKVRNKNELTAALNLMKKNADVIIVDTIGQSPKDAGQIGEMKELLEACGSGAEYYLTVSATTKALDLVSILRHFEMFAYRAVIVTKLDETQRAGNVISVLAEHGKPYVFLTDGQSSDPQSLIPADPIRLLINLDGFNTDRGRLEKRFGKIS